MNAPLADKIRPTCIEEMFGQQHLLGKDCALYNIIKSKKIPNMIFYGPSGVGKTTLARIIAEQSGMRLHKLNGTNCSTADIRDVIGESSTLFSDNGVLLYLDEIQYLSKKQQQSLLEYIENGSVTLIASTTENPYFYVYNAILSRCTTFEFKNLTKEEILPAVKRGFEKMGEEIEDKITVESGVCEHIAQCCGGDVRKSLNAVELCVVSAPSENGEIRVTKEIAKQVSQRSSMKYDRDGDEHYDIISAFQKSIRGSDENAALHYLARLVEAGDLISPCRRLLVIACEDIGLAHPNAISVVKSCVDSAQALGYPEARIPLAQAVIFLCTCPKSNSAIMAIDRALGDVKSGVNTEIPPHLKDSHYQGASDLGHGTGYKYPHAFNNHYVKQQYLPDSIKDRIYYEFGDNKNEMAAKIYREKIKGQG